MMEHNGSDFWRCAVGSAFGLTLALVWLNLGFGAFLLSVALTIIGGAVAWFFGRILA